MASVTDVLSKLESMNLLRTTKIVGNYMQIYCPFHSNGHEKKPSCGVLLSDEVRAGKKYSAGMTHCFTCHYAKPLPDMISDLLALHNIPKSGLDWLKENVPGFYGDKVDFDYLISPETFKSLTDKYMTTYITTKSKSTVEYVSEEELAGYRYTVPYMYERKLTDELIERYDVGFDPNWIPSGRKKPVPCITFPVRDKTGKCLFLCRRSIEGKIYAYPQGASKPLYGLYELPSVCRSVLVCESAINALTAISWGYNAVALLGTGNQLQVTQLKQLGVQEIVLCLDGDGAGRNATEKLKRALKSNCIVWNINMPDGKDVNDLTKEEFDLLYREKT